MQSISYTGISVLKHSVYCIPMQIDEKLKIQFSAINSVRFSSLIESKVSLNLFEQFGM